MFKIINGNNNDQRANSKWKHLKIGNWVITKKYEYAPVKITNINWFKKQFLCMAFNGGGEPGEDYEWNKLDDIIMIITDQTEIAELDNDLNPNNNQPSEPLKKTIPFVRPSSKIIPFKLT